MMANHKQQHLLHELLKEDQEPFLLKNYIADRKCQLKRPSPKTQLHVKKHKPSQNFCKNACFFSFSNPTYSPDPRKSPLFQTLHSPVTRSPCKSPNTICLRIPARTAAILLEAALKIQKQSTTSKTKNSNTFGLFGSFFKKITSRNKPRKLESNIKKCVKDEEIISGIGRNSSAVWSESNNGEKKSLDLDLDTSSCSSCDHDECEEDLVASEFTSFDQHEHFCDSPFHFVLRRSPSSGHRTPEFMLSPISSPSTTRHHHQFQGKENNNEVESLKKLQVEEEEEEDKEQCSPVSVLDPPFVDDDDGHDDPCEDDGFDLECSYAIVQHAKQKLLAKLRRFEKLAELDPVELEKRILEQETDDDDDNGNDFVGESNEDDQLVSPHDIEVISMLIVEEIISKPRLYGLSRVPKDMKRLVSDLINEEQKEQNSTAYEDEAIVKRVCKRLESWKEVESNTIDMMVDQDFKKDNQGWKENHENVKETAVEIELAIFGLLVEELSEELIGFNRWY